MFDLIRTIQGKVELTSTYDAALYARIRGALSASGIRYDVDSRYTGSDMGRGRSLLGSAGEDPTASTQYRIFVQKADLEAAQQACRTHTVWDK